MSKKITYNKINMEHYKNSLTWQVIVIIFWVSNLYYFNMA